MYCWRRIVTASDELKLKVLHFGNKTQWEINNIINFIPILTLWIIWVWFLNSDIFDSSFYKQLKWISIFPLTLLTIVSDLFRFRNNSKLIFSIDSIELVKRNDTSLIYYSDIEIINIHKQNWKISLYNRNVFIEIVQKDKKIILVVLENSIFNFGFLKFNKILKFLDRNSLLKSKVKNNGVLEITKYKTSNYISDFPQ